MPSARTPPPPERFKLPRWLVPLLALTATGLLPWTLWLTYSLPSRHVTDHYDLAWVGFDAALLAAVATTAVCAVRSSRWLVPSAAATATMLLCDAWFDVLTSNAGERLEAVLEAALAELPLAAICWFIVFNAERFQRETVLRYSAIARKMRETES
jgi:hypothetical protein